MAKKNTSLSPKVAKADKLRIEVNKAGVKSKSLARKWIAESEGESNPELRKKIDQKYNRLFEEADKAQSKAYQKYYDYVDDNFPKEHIATAMRKGLKTGGGFMGKTFISTLEKQQKAGKKK